MHSLLTLTLYACDCSLNVTLVLIIFDMILSKYFKQFPPTECFSSKDDDDDENTLIAATEMDAENYVVATGSSLPM